MFRTLLSRKGNQILNKLLVHEQARNNDESVLALG